MIDIHTHILPGIDDGSQSIEESIELATVAVREGITTLIATPHHGNGRYDNEAASIREEVSKLNEILTKANIPLTILPGQEARITSRFLDDLDAGHILPLNGTRYMLIEFPSDRIPSNTEEVLHELRIAGSIPIIAHPERNREIIEHPERLANLCRQGALSQLTSHSITGLFGKKLQRLSIDLCKHNLAHLVSSDVHNLTHRPFHLDNAYQELEKILGLEFVNVLKTNAEKVVNNEDILVNEPLSIKKSSSIWKKITFRANH